VSLNGRRVTVTAGLSGGLGNQLFQYAAARRLAHVNGASLLLDDRSGFECDPYHARYALDAFRIVGQRLGGRAPYRSRIGRIKRRVDTAWQQALPVRRRRYLREDQLHTPRELLELELAHRVYLDGGWQREEYFADIRDILRREFDLAHERDPRSNELARRMEECESVGLHIRRLRGRPNLPTSRPLPDDPKLHVSSSYYERATRYLIEKAGADHFFVFADYPEVVSEVLGDRLPFTVVAHNGMEKDYEDLWLMRQCKHFVIANSSFGWWAAWLGDHAHKRVVAPESHARRDHGLVSLPVAWVQL
jgi:hypothetical protein